MFPDTGPRQRRSSRSKKSMPSKGIQNIFNNVKSETVEKVISQLFFNDESSSPKACPSPNIEDLLSQPDGNVNTNESVTKVVSLLEGFGIDLQKQIKVNHLLNLYFLKFNLFMLSNVFYFYVVVLQNFGF